MDLISIKKNWGKWFPLIAVPILIIASYLIWRVNPFSLIMRTAGGPLALFLVHLVLFIVLRSYKANLLFALACFALVADDLSGWQLGGSLINDLFYPLYPQPLWFPAMSILLIHVIHKLFPNTLQKWFLYTFSILMAVLAIALMILDESIIAHAELVRDALLGLALLYAALMFVLKLRKIAPEQIAFLVGLVIFLYGYLHTSFVGSIPSSLSLVAFFIHHYVLLFFFLISASLLFATCREVIEANAENQRLAAQEIIAESQLDFQREQFSRLMETVESTKFMRHDMKHHLAVISEYVQADNMSGIKGYLEGMEYGLNSSRSKNYCDNYAVNAIISHYLSSAENDGVQVKVKLTVPAETGQIKDSDLCVIVGNLLENAVDACRDVDRDKRFIKLFSYISDNTITFTMENSFAGELEEWDGVFYSTKRDGEGIGLHSVAAVSEKYGGAARFEAKENVFYSSAYVDMGEF